MGGSISADGSHVPIKLQGLNEGPECPPKARRGLGRSTCTRHGQNDRPAAPALPHRLRRVGGKGQRLSLLLCGPPLRVSANKIAVLMAARQNSSSGQAALMRECGAGLHSQYPTHLGERRIEVWSAPPP
jgi:hypothetical protein